MFIVILHGASNGRNSGQGNCLHISRLLRMDPCCSPAPFTSNDSIRPGRQNTIPISISIEPLGRYNKSVTFWIPYFFQKSPIFIVAFIPLTALPEGERWGEVGAIYNERTHMVQFLSGRGRVPWMIQHVQTEISKVW